MAIRAWTSILLLTTALPAVAQQGAIITVLQGRVMVEQEAPVPQPAIALARLRPGDKLRLDADAVLQLVYFQNARQESWRGAARLEVGEEESRAIGSSAQPTVKQLPQMLVRQLVKTPTAESSGKVGAVRLRSIVPPDAAQKLDDNYALLRREADASDRTPELYLLAGLFELKNYGRIEANLKQWQDAAPKDAVLAAMAEHYRGAIRAAAQ